MEIAWRNAGKAWRSERVPRKVMCKANELVNLADSGLEVHSENARQLVKFFSDLEAKNEDVLEERRSSGKLGWHEGGKFLPYDEDICFDGEVKAGELYRSVSAKGDYEKWKETIRAVRATGRIEPRVALAASLAAPLVSLLNGLTGVVNIHGISGHGKTLCLKIAASVWGEPRSGKFMGNFYSTEVAYETRADVLNNLPIIMDDTAAHANGGQFTIEEVIYLLANGQGKQRSNASLGVEKNRTWNTMVLFSGEKDLRYFSRQGGALNRGVDFQSDGAIFNGEEGPRIADTLHANYGHCGREWVRHIRETGLKKLSDMFGQAREELEGKDRSDKQVLTLSFLLLADRLATQLIFKDGNGLRPEDLRPALLDKDEISDDKRAYDLLCSFPGVNMDRIYLDRPGETLARFNKDTDILYFVGTSLGPFLEKNGFSKQSFLNWADSMGKLVHGGDGKRTMNMRLQNSPGDLGGNGKAEGKPIKCYAIQLERLEEQGEDFHALSREDMTKVPF